MSNIKKGTYSSVHMVEMNNVYEAFSLVSQRRPCFNVSLPLGMNIIAYPTYHAVNYSDKAEFDVIIRTCETM
jgi:hypothetical protein